MLVTVIACGGTVKRPHPDQEGSGGNGATSSAGGTPTATSGAGVSGAGGGSVGGVGTAGTPLGAGGMAVGGDAEGGSGGSADLPSCECVGADCAPVTLWTQPDCGELALLVDARWLYALSPKLGTLTRTPLPPEAPIPETLATGLGGGAAFALDPKYAYVAANFDLYRVELETGDVIKLLSEPMTIRDVAVWADRVYYTFGQTVKQASTEPPTSGVVVATAQDAGMPQALTIEGSTLAFSTAGAYSVENKSLPNGPQRKLAPSQAGLRFGHRALQTDGIWLFWTNTNVVGMRLNPDADESQRTLAFARDGKSVDAFAVYGIGEVTYLTTEDGQIQKSTWDDAQKGVEATSMAQGLARMNSLVLDRSHVYAASGCSVVCMRQ
jgi:hypothetical protein